MSPLDDQPQEERVRRVQEVLERRGLTGAVSAEEANASWMQERFLARARALFYARLMFLALGLLILSVPVWRYWFSFTPLAAAAYVVMLMYSVTNYLALARPTVGRVITYVTLCLDLVAMVVLVATPAGGGLGSPLLATQLLFTTLFAILYPQPLAIVPPLLSLPVMARIDQLLDRPPTAIEVLTLLWYLALNFIIIYVLVYLNHREVTGHREVMQLQGDLKELAVVEERSRLAREIHDGLGATLSSLIIQAEYLTRLAKEEPLLGEIRELKLVAEESIEELRRALRMMRDDFDVATGVEEYVKTFAERTQLPVDFQRSGTEVGRLSPESSLALFRVLQESLSNTVKHAQARQVQVRLSFQPRQVELLVKDDGSGFDPRARKPGHYGLINMRERALKAGGDFSVDSTPGAGSEIHFSVPVQL